MVISIGIGGILLSQKASAVSGNAIYDDSLSSGWTSWSWDSEIDFGNESSVYQGSKKILWTPKGWGGLYFHSDGMAVSQDAKIKLAVKGNEPDQKLRVVIFGEDDQPTNGGVELEKYGGDIKTNIWTSYTIPLSDLKANGKIIKGIALQESAGKSSAQISIDSVEFIANEQNNNNPSVVDTLTTNSPLNIIFGKKGVESSWDDWSWKGQLSSIMVFSSTENGSGLYLHTEEMIDGATVKNLNFSAKADSQEIKYKVLLFDENDKPVSDGIKLVDAGGDLNSDWKNYQITIERLGGNNKKIKGVVFQDIGDVRGNLYIKQLNFDGSNSITEAKPNLTPTPTPVTFPTVNSAGYTTKEGKIYKDNSEITLYGINWFGFETGTHVVHGLWTRNYKDLITQIKSLGFNSVRLPICPATLHGVPTSSIDYAKNPDLKDLDSAQVLDKVIAEFNSQQIYVLLDHHTPDCQTITELWYTDQYSEQAWINDLTTLAVKYKNYNYFMGVDLKNEPHGQATWASGKTDTDWNVAAEKAGAEILKVNPNVLIFVAGIQDSSKCSDSNAHFWGGNLSVVSCSPIDSMKIPTNKLVYTPHVYGPDVSFQNYFGASSFPGNMPEIWKNQFGFLKNNGTATIVPGEWGGKYGNGGDSKDVTFQNALVSYFIANKICSSYYWSFNPNSGDTGGVLKDDWTTPWGNKLTLLQNYFNQCKTN